MGIKTDIPWCAATWNCWQGCHKVSEGCKNCYMFRDKKRYGDDGNVVVRSGDDTFFSPLKWDRNYKLKPGAFVFVCSWSDFFIAEADPWRDEAFEIMDDTPYTYLVLTKRPERIRPGSLNEHRNVWLGVSTENQEMYDHRWSRLHDIAATRHFISWEPALGPLNLTRRTKSFLPQWVIAGCESGPFRRPSDVDDIRSVRDQCVELGIPFFLKQMDVGGEVIVMPELDGRIWAEKPRAVV